MTNKYREALELVSKAEQNIKNKIQWHKSATDAISTLRWEIDNVQKTNIDLSQVMELSKQADGALAIKNYQETVECINKAKDILESLKNKLKEAHNWLYAAKSQIEDAKKGGMDTTASDAVLKQAEEKLKAKNLEQTITLAKQSIEELENMKNRSIPKIKINLLSADKLKKDIWNKLSFNIKNNGNTDGKNIKILFPPHYEIKGIRAIPYLKINEDKTIEFAVKPKETGNLPVDVQIECQRVFDDKTFQYTNVVWLNVETTTPTLSQPQVSVELPEIPKSTGAVLPSFCTGCGKQVQQGWKRCPFCKTPLIKSKPKEDADSIETKIYNYILAHNGTIKISQCALELNISKEQIKNTLKTLEEKGKLNR